MADADAPGCRLCRTNSSLNPRSCCCRWRLDSSCSLFMVCTISSKRTPPSGSTLGLRCLPSAVDQARMVVVGLLPMGRLDAHGCEAHHSRDFGPAQAQGPTRVRALRAHGKARPHRL
jgi:hypothetical protein